MRTSDKRETPTGRARASYALMFAIAIVCAGIAYVAKPSAPNASSTYYVRAMAALIFVLVAIVLKLLRELFEGG